MIKLRFGKPSKDPGCAVVGCVVAIVLSGWVERVPRQFIIGTFNTDCTYITPISRGEPAIYPRGYLLAFFLAGCFAAAGFAATGFAVGEAALLVRLSCEARHSSGSLSSRSCTKVGWNKRSSSVA